MTSRARDRRRAAGRTPGILRGPGPAPEVAERAVQHGARGRGRVGWRIFSGLVVLSLVGVLFLFFSADIFYIHSINVAGLRYITKEEVYGLADIANMHLFWVDPTEVRRSLLRSPTIADAQVEVGWPPNMVQIVVEERQPALTWEQAGVATWVDLQGRVMRQRENRKDLVRIVADNAIEGPLGPNVQVPSEVVAGALQIKSLYPNIEMLRYNPNKGLGYQDGRGWEVWFGTGTDMPEKLRIYTAMVNNLLSRGIQPSEVNVVNPDAPYYRKLGA